MHWFLGASSFHQIFLLQVAGDGSSNLWTEVVDGSKTRLTDDTNAQLLKEAYARYNELYSGLYARRESSDIDTGLHRLLIVLNSFTRLYNGLCRVNWV